MDWLKFGLFSKLSWVATIDRDDREKGDAAILMIEFT